jgi:hypothetical protein
MKNNYKELIRMKWKHLYPGIKLIFKKREMGWWLDKHYNFFYHLTQDITPEFVQEIEMIMERNIQAVALEEFLHPMREKYKQIDEYFKTHNLMGVSSKHKQSSKRVTGKLSSLKKGAKGR